MVGVSVAWPGGGQVLHIGIARGVLTARPMCCALSVMAAALLVAAAASTSAADSR